MVTPHLAVGSDLGFLMVDSLVRLFLAMVAPAFLGLRVALALVVVDSLAVVYPLAHLGLVVGVLLVVLVVLAVVVDPMDLLALLVAHRYKTRPPVAAPAGTAHHAVALRALDTFPRTGI